MIIDNQKAILGTGLAFPIQTNPRGEIQLVSSDLDIAQSIQIILGTHPGERVMRPTFGCRVHEMMFEPRDSTTMSLIKKYVDEALQRAVRENCNRLRFRNAVFE